MAKKLSFEESLARLEQITSELEAGNLPLEESLQKFDEGMKLANMCNEKLAEAEQKVSLLLQRDQKLVETSFPVNEHESE